MEGLACQEGAIIITEIPSEYLSIHIHSVVSSKCSPTLIPSHLGLSVMVGHGTEREYTCSRRGSRPETLIPLSRWSGFGPEIAKHTIGALAKSWEQTATLFISRKRNHGLPLIATICSGTDG